VDHDDWLQTDGSRIAANRLVLPAETHYDALGAFIVTHLIDNGATDDLVKGFGRAEPVISVILESWVAQEDAMIGLSGELLVLREMLRQAPDKMQSLMSCWQGHQHTARDFQLGEVGVEVKTTRRDQSRHHINGVRQVELGHRRDGGLETHLYLVSVGVALIGPGESAEHAWSLPALIDDVLAAISTADLKLEVAAQLSESFLERVRQYGEGGWYDHVSESARAMRDQVFRTTFLRTYDMTDEAILVPRSADVVGFTMVLASTVRFEVELPKHVQGDVNPVAGVVRGISQLLDAAWPNLD
jgi:hypothetical protein